MAYSISYQTVGKMKYPRYHRRKKRSFRMYIVIFLAAGAFFVHPIRHFLLPGNPEVTEQALSALVTDIQEGQTPMEAITTFCRTILEDGK